MKKIVIVLVLVFVALISTSVIAANENGVFLPLIYGGSTLISPTETPTPTPEDVEPTATLPTDTPTSTPGFDDDYNWVFVGRAGNVDGVLIIYGVSPGYCYDVRHTKVEKTIYLEAVKIPIGDCDRDGYNPDADWPPPEFPPPPSLPPEFAYGDVYKLVLDINAKVVCSVFWPENCKNVQ